METTEKVLRELLVRPIRAMEARIQDDQRNLYERVPAEVRANMQEAFERAADEPRNRDEATDGRHTRRTRRLRVPSHVR